MPRNKVGFTAKQFQYTSREKIRDDIMQSDELTAAMRKEVRRVFQVANRRIQNLEKSGVASPALIALGKGNIEDYSKFSISRLGSNTFDIQREYAAAIAFLQNPTSTASGARTYEDYLIAQNSGYTREFIRATVEKYYKPNGAAYIDNANKQTITSIQLRELLEMNATAAEKQMRRDSEETLERLQDNIDDMVEKVMDMQKALGDAIEKTFDRYF